MTERPRPPVQIEPSTDRNSFAVQLRRDIRRGFTVGFSLGAVGVVGLVTFDTSDYKNIAAKAVSAGLVFGGAWVARSAATRLTDFSFGHIHPESNGVIFEAKEEKDLQD